MIKKTIFWLVLLTICVDIKAQKKHWLSDLSINVETAPAQLRFFKNTIRASTSNGNSGTNWIGTVSEWEWYTGIGVPVTRKIFSELGYYRRFYHGGINSVPIPKCTEKIGKSTSIDEADHLFLRVFYTPIIVSILKKPLNFQIGLGLTQAYSVGPSGFKFGDSETVCNIDSTKYSYFGSRATQDALQPTYTLFNTFARVNLFNLFIIYKKMHEN